MWVLRFWCVCRNRCFMPRAQSAGVVAGAAGRRLIAVAARYSRALAGLAAVPAAVFSALAGARRGLGLVDRARCRPGRGGAGAHRAACHVVRYRPRFFSGEDAGARVIARRCGIKVSIGWMVWCCRMTILITPVARCRCCKAIEPTWLLTSLAGVQRPRWVRWPKRARLAPGCAGCRAGQTWDLGWRALRGVASAGASIRPWARATTIAVV
jgi:hypothetical protein